jgi:Fur family ferric uptake transcriptional regulator
MERSAATIDKTLHDHGLRATAQRRAILTVFHPGEHLSADEVIERLDPAVEIDRATIYRTLERFRDLGLLSETDLGGGVRRFEVMLATPHHHLVCLRCQREFTVDDAMISPMREAIRERYGFAPRIDHLAIFGYCKDCQDL